MNAEEKELLDIIGDANAANNLLHGESGKTLKAIADHQVELAERKLCFEVLNERQRDVLIERIRFLKYKLFDELRLKAQDGDIAYQELEDKRLLRESEPDIG